MDIGDGYPDLIGYDLGKTGVVALALRAHAGSNAHLAAGLNSNPGALVRADTCSLDVADDGDADPLAGGFTPRLLLADELLIADQFQRSIKSGLIVTAVVNQLREVLKDDLVIVRELLWADEVVATNRHAVNVQLFGSDVQQPLHHEDAVLATCAAVGCDDRLVGEDAGERGVVIGHDIGAEKGTLAADGNREPIRRVGAGVMEEYVLHAQNCAIILEGYSGVVYLSPFLGRSVKVLLPILDPLERAA